MTAPPAPRTDDAPTDTERIAATKGHLALNRRLQVVASNELLEEFDAWMVKVEAVSVGDLLRRAIYLLGRMIEAGIDPHRQEGHPRRGARFGILLSGASLDRLTAGGGHHEHKHVPGLLRRFPLVQGNRPGSIGR